MEREELTILILETHQFLRKVGKDEDEFGLVSIASVDGMRATIRLIDWLANEVFRLSEIVETMEGGK